MSSVSLLAREHDTTGCDTSGSNCNMSVNSQVTHEQSEGAPDKPPEEKPEDAPMSPTTLRIVGDLLAKQGPVVVIALGLVYFMVTVETAKLDQLITTIEFHEQRVEARAAEHRSDVRALVAIASQICVSAAETEQQRAGCFAVQRYGGGE